MSKVVRGRDTKSPRGKILDEVLLKKRALAKKVSGCLIPKMVNRGVSTTT